MTTRVRLRPEAGATMIECLVAVSILGIAFVAIIGGMFTSITASDIHRKQADAGASLRSYAEEVKAAPYASCATTSSYSASAVSYTAPSGYTASTTAVEYWQADADPSAGSWVGTCTADPGLQKITLQVVAPENRATETVDVVKRRT